MKDPNMELYDKVTVKRITDRMNKGEKLSFHERNILRIAEKRNKKKK